MNQVVIPTKLYIQVIFTALLLCVVQTSVFASIATTQNKAAVNSASIFEAFTAAEKAWLEKRKEITIAFDGDYAPYSFQDEEGQFSGIAVDFAKELASRVGLKLNIYHDGHWEQLNSAAQRREVDVIATLVHRPEREQWFEFTKPYLSLTQYIISTKEGRRINQREQISGKKVALIQGYSTSQALLDEFPEVVPYYVNSLSEALEAVSIGKAEFTVADLGMAQHLIAQRGIANLTFAVVFARELSEQRFGVRKDWPELAAILNKGLASLSYSEQLQIFQRWSHPDIADVTLVRSASIIDQLNDAERAWLSEHPKARIGVMDDWPPFNFRDKQGQPSGIGNDLLMALNQRFNGLLEIVPGSWKEHYEQVKEKQLDALMDITPKPEREDRFNFTTPYLDVPHVIIARRSAPYLVDETALNGKRVALERGFGNVKYFRENFPQVEIKEYDNTAYALGAVTRGEADAYAGNRGAALYLIKREVMLNLKVHGRLKKTGSILAIGTRKDWPVLRDILQKGLDDIQQDQQRAILSKWIAIEPEYSINLTPEEKTWLAEHEEIRVGLMDAWPPMDYVDSQGQARGIGASFLSAINLRLNNALRPISAPWKQIYSDVQEKRLDALFGITPLPEREPHFNFTNPYVSVPHVIFARNDRDTFNDLSDLQGKVVAVERGFFIVNILRNKYQGVHVKEFETTSDALDAVSQGTADAYVGNRAVAMYIIERELIRNLVQHSKIKETASVNAIGVRKDWPILHTILQKALDSMSKTEKQSIMRRWVFLEDRTAAVELQLTQQEIAWLAKHKKMRLGVDPAWPPFGFTDSAGANQGLVLDFMALLNDRLDLEMEQVKGASWAYILNQAQEGKVDILPSIMKSEQRSHYLDFTKPYLSFPMVILAHKDASFIQDLDELQDRRVAVIKGYITEEILLKKHPELTLVQYDAIDQALTAVSRGEADIYIDNIPAITYAIQQLGLEDLRITATTPYQLDLAIGVRKELGALVGIFNKLIDSIPESEKRLITQSWLNTRVQTKTDWWLVLKISSTILVISFIVLTVILIWNQRLQREVAWRKQAEAELKASKEIVEAANLELLEVDQLKSLFIASMSHELRTPLNSIIGFTGVMLLGMTGDLNEKQHNQLGRVNKAAKHLLSLITDIIDISKVEAGKMDVYLEDVQLDELIDEAASDIKHQLEAKDLQLDISVPSTLQLYTDRKRVLQCVLNLMSNAVKYTEQGRVSVVAKEMADQIKITVSDTGIGIPEANRAQLFQPFERLNSPLKIKAGGTGLGLYLTKKIAVELLNGEVDFESQEGVGSTFIIILNRRLESEGGELD